MLSTKLILLVLPLVSSLSIHAVPHHDVVTSRDYNCTARFWEWRSPRNLVACLADLRLVVMSAFESPQLVLSEAILTGPAFYTTSDVSTTLNISNMEITPDGFTRIAIVANKSFPGPLITGYKNHILVVNVTNSATDPLLLLETSIHWHGIDQHKTNWADGVDWVNQCPIVAGASFLYRFNLTDPGTYWYHSHSHTQYCDGLRGPLIVYDPEDPYLGHYDVDDENTVITIGDWSHAVPATRQYDSTVINGLGRSRDAYTGSINDAPLAVVNVEHGKRYRLRVINLGCDPNYIFSIEGHTMNVISADAVEHQALPVDSVQIFAGQRYSVILHANATIGNYWIWAKPNNGDDRVRYMTGGMNSAILRYVGAPAVEPITKYVDPVRLLKESDLRPVNILGPDEIGLPGWDGADVNIPLILGFNQATKKFTLGGQSFVNPTMPYLLQILNGANVTNLTPSQSVISLPLNKVIQISFPMAMNDQTILDSAPHPMHLHGHFFSVVRSAGEREYIWDNPPRRDVVSVGTNVDDLTTIRFKTDNAGPWLLHCHIDFHLEGGLAIVLTTGTYADMSEPDRLPPSEWRELCPRSV